MGVLLNLFFAWFLWKLGCAHLDNEDEPNKFIGWLGIAISAMNFAVAMSEIF